MSSLAFLLTWENVPFVVALGVAVAFALLQMSGVLGALAGHADVDVHADADVDVDADADGGHDGDHDSHGGLGSAVLAHLGVGKAPLFVLGETFLVTFGITGIAWNALRLGKPGHGAGALAVELLLATAVGLLATRALAGALGRVLGEGSEASSRADLVGVAGVVISTRVDREFGEVRLRDRSGQVVRVICRAEGEAIPEGREVVVIDEDPRDQRLVVAALDPRAP